MERQVEPAGPSLVLEAVSTEDGAPLPLRAARLIASSGEQIRLFTACGEGRFQLAFDGVEPGGYQLRVDLHDHPTLPFDARITQAARGLELEFVEPAPRCWTLARAGDDLRATLRTTPRHHEMILVAGWDYSGGADNTKYAATFRDDRYAGKTHVVESRRKVRRDQPAAREIFDHTMVTLFDFASGMRTRWWKGVERWHEIDRYLQGTVPTYTGKYNDPDSFKRRHDDDSISITHVYDYVIARGSIAPGCVAGLHIFSHAWDGGPLLVNTDQQHPYGYGQPKGHRRDPGDKDGRAFDFSEDNMPRRADFRAAFAPTASVKLWGCLAVPDYRRMARAAMRALARKRPPDEQFEVELPSRTTYMTLAGIEAEFRYTIIADAYATRLAEAAGVPVYGPPPGAGANLQRVSGRDYMYVNQSTYAKLLAYFERVLDMPHDATGYLRYQAI